MLQVDFQFLSQLLLSFIGTFIRLMFKQPVLETGDAGRYGFVKQRKRSRMKSKHWGCNCLRLRDLSTSMPIRLISLTVCFLFLITNWGSTSGLLSFLQTCKEKSSACWSEILDNDKASGTGKSAKRLLGPSESNSRMVLVLVNLRWLVLWH